MEKKELKHIQKEIKEQGLSWEAEENPLSILPNAVQRRFLGYDYEGEGTSAEQEEEKAKKNFLNFRMVKNEMDAIPSKVDWRAYNGKNYVTKVKNQGNCGSCVSFATAAAMESVSRVRMKMTGDDLTLPLLSEASLHYCAGRGCNGWNLTDAFRYAKTTGAVPAALFPYKDSECPCKPTETWEKERTKMAEYTFLKSAEDMMRWLAQKGPLATRFNVYSDFYAYKSGIYEKTASAKFEGGHAILCVGYDKDNNAWICKNSWGTSWGDKGYFKIRMGECGIDAQMYGIEAFSPLYPVYTDVMSRDNFSDYGQSGVSGNVCSSPDIVPVGIQALADPQELKNSWFQDVGKNPVVNANNVVYMRGISHNPKETDAKLYLYYSKASVLLYPEQWENNRIPCSDGKDYYEAKGLKQGDLFVSDAPFVWKPEPVKGDHYCLVGRVVTDAHPNPIPDLKNVQSFAQFVSNNPNYCMRNVTLVEKDVPDFSIVLQYQQGTLGADMHFILENSGCPADAEFSISCTNSASNPPVNINRQKVPPDKNLTGIVSAVPAGFEGELLFHFWNQSAKKVSADWELRLSVFYIVPKDAVGQFPESAFEKYRAIGPKPGILLGSYSIKTQ